VSTSQSGFNATTGLIFIPDNSRPAALDNAYLALSLVLVMGL
jgi:hypothetical protein